jgi:hypothetical protein
LTKHISRFFGNPGEENTSEVSGAVVNRRVERGIVGSENLSENKGYLDGNRQSFLSYQRNKLI